MKFSNNQMKVDSIVSYINDGKINLIPPFQRGSVWKLPMRQKLMENIVQARPIPAIFLYREADGSKFAYNILDGKQRLETLILFVGNKRKDLKITKAEEYFFKKPANDDLNFTIEVDGKSVSFAELEDSLVRSFREFPISTVEIDLDDETSGIDEVVSLFIDINLYGTKVSRFDIVKAIGKDPIFKHVFSLVALKQKRKRDVVYKAINSPFVFVLKRLSVVSRLVDRNARVDRMWERLTEIALFARTMKHRAPVDILKGFIHSKEMNAKLSAQELRALRSAFDFLAKLYRTDGFMDSKLATDQPQFYTLVTTLIAADLRKKLGDDELKGRLLAFRDAIQKPPKKGPLSAIVREYLDLSTKQTTHPSRREARQQLLLDALDLL